MTDQALLGNDDRDKALEAAGNLVRSLEESFDVNALTFRGIRIWPRLRSLMTFAYTDGFFAGEQAHIKRHATVTALDIVSGIPAELSALANGEAKDLDSVAKKNIGRPVLFLGTKPRRAVLDGRSWNLLFDPIAKLWGNGRPKFINLTLQNEPAADELDHDNTVHLKIDGLSNFMSRLDYAQDLLAEPSTLPRRIEHIEEFWAALPEELASVLSIAAISKDAASIQRLATILRIYLERARPPCVFISGQKRVNMAMTLAARQLAIPTIDIQHGASVYSPQSFKWHSWRAMPDEGYDLLPDYFWVWGDGPADMIRSTGNPNCQLHKPIVGGNPALLYESPFKSSDDFTEKLKSSGNRILVTLGPLDNDGFPQPLVEAMAAAPKRWLWLIRAHPQDWGQPDKRKMLQRILKQARVKRFDIETSTLAPLGKLLRSVSWHVTPYSSSAVEATAFGVPTLFVHPLGAKIYGYLFERDGFEYAVEPGQIISCLSKEAVKVDSMVRMDRPAAVELLRKLVAGESPL